MLHHEQVSQFESGGEAWERGSGVCSAGRPLQPGLVTHFPRGAPQLAQLPNTAVPPLQDTPLQHRQQMLEWVSNTQ